MSSPSEAPSAASTRARAVGASAVNGSATRPRVAAYRSTAGAAAAWPPVDAPAGLEPLVPDTTSTDRVEGGMGSGEAGISPTQGAVICRLVQKAAASGRR